MKKIEDYLHLYVGCEVAAPNPYDDHGVEIAKGLLTGIHGEYGPEIQFIIDGNTEEDPDYVEFLKVKPILRRLSSMTEEEQKELWRLVFSMGHGNEFTDRFKDFTGRVQFIDEKTYYNVPRHVMMQGVERLGIESDGTVWADCDLHKWRHNQHEVTRWLLSKGFDLFGLIDEGLAIDAATLEIK